MASGRLGVERKRPTAGEPKWGEEAENAEDEHGGLFFRGRLITHGIEALIGFVELEERASIVDQVVHFFDRFLGLSIDEQSHAADFNAGDIGDEFGLV